MMTELRKLWRYWSVKLAALWGLVVAYLVATPQTFTALTSYVPEHWRPAAGIVAGFVAFALPTLLRGAKQPKLSSDK